MEPPPPHTIHSALRVLCIVGALEPSGVGEDGNATPRNIDSMMKSLGLKTMPAGSGNLQLLDDASLVLTPLGSHLAELPMDVRLGKMLIYGGILGCLDTIATAVAVLTTKSPYQQDVGSGGQSCALDAEFLCPYSDTLTVVNIYNAFQRAPNKRTFCTAKGLAMSVLVEYEKLREEFVAMVHRALPVLYGKGLSSDMVRPNPACVVVVLCEEGRELCCVDSRTDVCSRLEHSPVRLL